MRWAVLAMLAAGACSRAGFEDFGGDSDSDSDDITSGDASPGDSLSGDQDGDPDPGVLAVVPSSITLIAGQFYPFRTNGSDPVTWSIDETGGIGAFDTAGGYTAPSAPITIHVRATRTSDSATATAEVTIELAVTHTVASTGALGDASGAPWQSRLIYVDDADTWWLFYLDDEEAKLHSKSSPDLVTWQAGPDLTMGADYTHQDNGLGLAVTFASINGHDVFHLLYSHLNDATGTGSDDGLGLAQGCSYNGSTGGGAHIRAALNAGTLTFVGPNEVTCLDYSPGYNEAGSVLLMPSPDGMTPIVSSGIGWAESIDEWDNAWNTDGTQALCGVGDANVFESLTGDTGTAFDGSGWIGRTAWCVPGTLEVRQLVWDGARVWLLGAWNAAEPMYFGYRIDPQGLDPVSWDWTGPVPQVFPGTDSQELTDWMGAVAQGALHVVRRTNAGSPAYEHVVASADTLVAGDTIPVASDAGLDNGGLYLAPSGSGLILYAFAASHSLRWTRWDGASWSAWRTLLTTTREGAHLSGYTSPLDGRTALLWTEKASAPYELQALIVR